MTPLPPLADYLPKRRAEIEAELEAMRPAEDRIRALRYEWLEVVALEAVSIAKAVAAARRAEEAP